MARGGEHQSRRVPVIRVTRSGRRKVQVRRPTRAMTNANRRRSTSAHVVASTPSSSVVPPAVDGQVQLRNMRAEKRRILQQLAETERRAKAAEEERDELQDDTEKTRLLQKLADAESRAKSAEKERDELRDDKDAMWDEGTDIWQNVWSREDTSNVLTFPTTKSVVCDSAHVTGGNCFPGVHSDGFINNGRTTQSIWMKGMGYTLVGLVTSDEEKTHLRRCAGDDYTKLPMMTPLFSENSNEREGDVFTIEIDMIERRAELYISKKDSSRQLEPHQVWEELPEKVWVAIAFKRNSGREAVLMPCIHWNMTQE